MRRYLQFDNNVATGQLLTSSVFDPSGLPSGRVMVDVTDRPDAVIGCAVTGLPANQSVVVAAAGDNTIVFTAPTVTKTHVTKLQFFKSFTADEWHTFKTTMATDHTLEYAYDMLVNASSLIDITDTTFTDMLTYCVTASVITQARHDAIVASLAAAAV